MSKILSFLHRNLSVVSGAVGAVTLCASFLLPSAATAGPHETQALLDPFDSGIQWEYGHRGRRLSHGDHWGGEDGRCAIIIIVDPRGDQGYGLPTYRSLTSALRCANSRPARIHGPITILVAPGRVPITSPRQKRPGPATISVNVHVRPLKGPYTFFGKRGEECVIVTGGNLRIEGAGWASTDLRHSVVPCIYASGGTTTLINNRFNLGRGQAIITLPSATVNLDRTKIWTNNVGVLVEGGRVRAYDSWVVPGANQGSASYSGGGWTRGSGAVTVRGGTLDARGSVFSGDIGLSVLGGRGSVTFRDGYIYGRSAALLLDSAKKVVIETAELEVVGGGTVVQSRDSGAWLSDVRLIGGAIGLRVAGPTGPVTVVNSWIYGQSQHGTAFTDDADANIASSTTVFYKSSRKQCYTPRRLPSGVDFDAKCERDSKRGEYEEEEDSYDESYQSGSANGRDSYDDDSYDDDSGSSGEGRDYGDGDPYAPPPSDDPWYGTSNDSYSRPTGEEDYEPRPAGYSPSDEEEESGPQSKTRQGSSTTTRPSDNPLDRD
jgi:hypothetical protein